MRNVNLAVCLLVLSAISSAQVINNKFKRAQMNKAREFKACSKSKNNLLMDDYDISFYMLDLSAGNSSAYLEGSATINATVLNNVLDTFVVELFSDYTVDSVLINNKKQNHLIDGDEIIVPVSPALNSGSDFSAQIFYRGELSQEIQDYGIGITNNAQHGVTYTLSEPFFAKFWYPCKQDLSDKADSVYVFITVDSTLKAGSNGLLTSTVPVGGSKVRYEWKSRYPITYYLISLCISDYVEYNIYAKPDGLEDSVLIQNYLYDSAYLEEYKEVIDATRDLIEIYSEIYGMYPFKDEKYGHCLAPMSGGMEHQTMTTLSELDFNLISHELAHQWFGDHVTCGTWQDIWINEGFATYSELLAVEQFTGEFPVDYYNSYYNYALLQCLDGSVFIPEEDVNIDFNDGSQIYDLTMRIFDFPLSYVKGALMLHMIRFELQDDGLFFTVLRNFLSEYSGGFATGLDFKAVLESTSGIDFTDFFNQWYFGQGYPVYNILWDQESDTLVICSKQTTTSEATTIFKMTMEYRIFYEGNDTVMRLFHDGNNDTFKIYIPCKVDSIIVNQDNDVLARMENINLSNISEKYYHFNEISFRALVYENYIEIEFNDIEPEKTVMVRDITGRLIYHGSTCNKSLIIRTDNLREGVYLIEVIEGNRRTVKKIIRQ